VVCVYVYCWDMCYVLSVCVVLYCCDIWHVYNIMCCDIWHVYNIMCCDICVCMLGQKFILGRCMSDCECVSICECVFVLCMWRCVFVLYMCFKCGVKVCFMCMCVCVCVSAYQDWQLSNQIYYTVWFLFTLFGFVLISFTLFCSILFLFYFF